MLASRDISDVSWGRTCNNNSLETTTTELCYDKLIDESPKTRSENKTVSTSILRRKQKTRWPPETARIIVEFDSLISIKKQRLFSCYINNAEELHAYYKLQEPHGGSDQAVSPQRVARLQKNCKHGYKIKRIRSEPCIGKLNSRNMNSVLENRMGYAIHKLDKGLLSSVNTYPQITHATSELSYKIGERNRTVNFVIKTGLSVVTQICLLNTYNLVNNYVAYSTKSDSRMHMKNTSIMVLSPQMEYSEYNLRSIKRFHPLLGPVLEKSSLLQESKKKQNDDSYNSSVRITIVPNFEKQYIPLKKEEYKEILKSTADHRFDSSIRQSFTRKPIINKLPRKSKTCNHELLAKSNKVKEEYERDLHRQSPFPNLKILIGPYAQIQTVYNVMEQTAAQMKEKGTSQQFKQRSQGIGSGSVSDVKDSSSASSKRRTIKIESGISFSVEFIDKGKSTVSDVSSHEPESDQKKKGGKEKKKSLHRCLCTTSFPTDDKKLKNKSCDVGVCEPGKCSPSECFKRLQEKYGSKKKKSDSDISSSQASQTSKKRERAGKETVVKEKGSSSISKYKETVEEKPPPKKEKFNIVTCMTKCCNKLKFWKKDKSIELKPAVIGTDISVKDETKSYGSNAATQSGKKAKKDKKSTDKDIKAETATEEKGTGKKGKKAKIKDAKKPAEKKGKKKAAKEEVKTETKATGKEMKKTKPLKPYECEPGVCSPKVCIPKECYERKFPPPPPQKVSSLTKFKNCLRKVCCKRPVGQNKADSGLNAATQSPKSAPEKTPGVTVYQEKGTSGPKTAKKRGQKGEPPGVAAPVETATAATESRKSKKRGKQKIDTGVQLPVDGGDVPIDGKKSKKPTAYSGIQYFQTIDNERMTTKQGLNIGSECSCSVEFYKMLY